MSEKKEEATFAAGCFWGVEDAFRKMHGVVDTEVGYTGGHMAEPTYEDVCTGNTGHAESLHLWFDPEQVTYEELLDRFWKLHDPTQVNMQGPDVGHQYRSAIFYHTPEQQQQAEKSKEALEDSGTYSDPVATEIVQAGPFYRAEEYHQQYTEKTGQGGCHVQFN